MLRRQFLELTITWSWHDEAGDDVLVDGVVRRGRRADEAVDDVVSRGLQAVAQLGRV
jgi:hypothetical protein